jgi:hypothetical protein
LRCKQGTYGNCSAKLARDFGLRSNCYCLMEYAQVWGGMFSKRH